MKLKFIVTNESDLPEDETLKKLYTKQGDKWVMDIEGAVPKTQLDEFRTNNNNLKKELEVYGKEGERLTPEQLTEIKRKAEELDAGTSKDKIDALVEKRVGEMKQAHQTELEAERGKTKKLQGDLEAHVIDRALIEAGTEAGLRPTAHEDITFRGRKTFKLDEHGKPVAIDADGNIRYNAAGDPLTPKDFVTELTKSATHLFDTSAGSGAGGGGGGGGGGEKPGANKNPWAKDSYNVTQQSAIYAENPEKARAMAAQVGVKI